MQGVQTYLCKANEAAPVWTHFLLQVRDASLRDDVSCVQVLGGGQAARHPSYQTHWRHEGQVQK